VPDLSGDLRFPQTQRDRRETAPAGLHGVTRGASIAAPEAIAVLRPQLGGAVLSRELLGVSHRIDELGSTVPGVGRARLVKVLAGEHPVLGTLDRIAAVLDLTGDGAVSILGALRGLENAVDPVELRQVQHQRRTMPAAAISRARAVDSALQP